MKFTPLKTSKLFYKKWPYKISCIQSGANKMHRNINGTISDWAVTVDRWGSRQHWAKEDRDKLQAFYNKVKPFYDKELQIRVEGAHFNIFCKDKNLLENIQTELAPWICAVYGPGSEEELEFMMANGHKKRVCSQLPKEKFKYRIYIKESMPGLLREQFYTWVQNYKGKIDFPYNTEVWLNGTKKWAYNPYIYLDDSAIVSMATLFLGGHIKYVEEFILRSSINTKS